MAGRGGGGGRTAPGIIQMASALNIDRSEFKTVGSGVQPPPLFPPVDFKHLPLIDDDSDALAKDSFDYMLNIKKSLMLSFREGPFYVEAVTAEKDIDRYSDTLKKPVAADWEPLWDRLPTALYPPSKLKQAKSSAMPSGQRPAKRPRMDDLISSDKLERLEKAEAGASGADVERSKSEAASTSGDDEVDEDLDEKKKDVLLDDERVSDDEEEEISDYVHSYFEPGDDYVEDSADENPDDAATY